MDYNQLLEHSYKEHQKLGLVDNSRLEYLAKEIFDFTTYDGEKDILFAKKAVEVCKAISSKTTFDYHGASDDNYNWYLVMCNMPFFNDKISWGTSIRGAWWDTDVHTRKIKYQSLGLWDGEKQLHEPMEFTTEEWEAFIKAVIEFAEKEDEPITPT